MKKIHKLFIRIIVVGNTLFILSQVIWEVSHHRIYWYKWEMAKPQTWWQWLIDVYAVWWDSLAKETILWFGFTMAGIIFFFLSIVMDE